MGWDKEMQRALEADGEKLRALTDQDHGPNFVATPFDELLEAMRGIVHFSDALAYREDTLSVALRQWIEAGRAALAKVEGH